MRTRSPGRASVLALAATTAMLVLSGCADAPPPGAAAVVDGTRISRSDVTELADAQCAGIQAAAKSGQAQAQATPRRRLVQQSLTLLMDIELNQQYGKSQGVEPRPQEVAAAYSQVEPLLRELPKKYQPFMDDTFHRWAEGRDMITQVGEKASGQKATTGNADQLINAGYQQRQAWLKHVDITTDPRYGPDSDGLPGGGDPSVSKAVSDFARSAAKDQPDAAWVSSLPSSQKCS